MKKIIFSALLLASAYSHADLYAIVNDPDGAVNIRQTQSLSSKIVGKVPNGTPLFCETYDDDTRYCYIKLRPRGYIHKSRLDIFNEKSDFKTVPLESFTPTKSVYRNDKVTVIIEVEEKTLNIKDFTRGKVTYLYKGREFYGTDGSLPDDAHPTGIQKTYFFKQIQVTIDGKTLAVPKTEFADLFIPDFSVKEDNVLKYFHIFINPKDNHLYIINRLADGSATYYPAFEFKNGKYYKRYVWNGE